MNQNHVFGTISYQNESKILYIERFKYPNESMTLVSMTYTGRSLTDENFLFNIESENFTTASFRPYRSSSIQPYVEDLASGQAGKFKNHQL